MITKEPCEIVTEVVADVVCDLCNQSCKQDVLGTESFEYAIVEAEWGWGSKFDGYNFEFHLCENCFEKLFGHLLPQSLETRDWDELKHG